MNALRNSNPGFRLKPGRDDLDCTFRPLARVLGFSGIAWDPSQGFSDVCSIIDGVSSSSGALNMDMASKIRDDRHEPSH